MGKIHKALEKSKKERQEKSKSNSSAILGTGISLKDSNSQRAGGRNFNPSDSLPVSRGLDLGTIHELLHESAEAGAPKLSDKNGAASKKIHDVPVIKKEPAVSLSTAEHQKLSVKKNDEKITANFEFGKNGSPQKSSDANEAQDTQIIIPADAPLTKTDLTGSTEKNSISTKPTTVQKYESVKNEKISALTPNKTSEKKVFILKDKTLNETAREEVADKAVTDYAFKDDSAGPDSGSIDYSTVDRSLVALLKPRSYEAEQFKILRTNLLFPESGNPARSILVTSAAPGDGKSFVSANLAVSLALNNDRKVLLIDADVRRSGIHKIFGLNHVKKGICDFLTDRIPLHSLLVKTSLKNLVILPAGELTRNLDEFQSLEKLPKLFEELAGHYGEYFTVIDSPPPKLASETGVLSRLVDSIVIVIKAGVTKREYVEETIDLLEKGKVAGIVFNWHDNRMSNYKKYAKNREYYS